MYGEFSRFGCAKKRPRTLEYQADAPIRIWYRRRELPSLPLVLMKMDFERLAEGRLRANDHHSVFNIAHDVLRSL